ncbi:MAG: NUDIX domain-containing protein [Actinomycetia bacterium]|nr:NUDIX domain-containing protein [Actinomycetes bacterium]
MTGRHDMWDGRGFLEVDVPVSGDEKVMVPVIRAIVRSQDDCSLILLQRRAEVSEPVFRCLEIPGGRWRSGESPLAAITREVLEETGVHLVSVAGISVEEIDLHRSIATVRPLAIIAGVEGAFPAVHVVLTAIGVGVPRASIESEDVRWWAIEDLEERMGTRPDEFVPSSLAALRAYMGSGGSTAG